MGVASRRPNDLASYAFPTDSERLRVIYAVARLLASPLRENVILGQVCELLSQLRHYLFVGVGSAGADGSVTVLSTSGPAGYEVRWDHTPAGAGAIGQAIRSGVGVVISRDDPGWRHWAAESGLERVRAIAAFPFNLDETVGVLYAHTDIAEQFERPEMELLQCIADDVGRTIDNERMRASLALERDRAKRSQDRLRALWTMALATDVDPDSQAQALIAEGTATLGFEWGAIGHLEGDALVIDVVGTDARFDNARRHPLDVTLSSEAIASDKMFAHEDLAADARYAMSPAVLENGLRAFAAAPFKVNTRRFVLAFGGSRALGRLIDDEDKSYVDLLVSFFSRALRQRDDQNRIRYLQNHDPLTGLPNRERFLSRLEELIDSVRRRESRFALLTIDADRFKRTVESLGLEAGDEIIAELGRRLAVLLFEGQELFRNAGDSFAIIIPLLQSPEQADRLARAVIEAVAAPIHNIESDVAVSASIGMAIYPDDGETPQELTFAAAAALRRAKQVGTSEYRFFSAELELRLGQRRRLMEELKVATERDELVMYYQPWIDLATGAITGCEALVRWQHPLRGLMQPLDFIPVAEEGDLIHDVGAWIFSAAARQAQRFATGGHPLIVAINLSARQFGDPMLAHSLRNAIKASGCSPRLLELEITESATMRDPQLASATLAELRALGLRVALDDFGIGHSSLAYLKHLPVDIIKIDQLFVRGLPDQSSDAAIARAIVALASSIGCEVRAEGVEHPEQAQWLHGSGARTAQGFWIARPMPASDLIAWLAARK